VRKPRQGNAGWLEMEWSEGIVGKTGRPVREVTRAGVRAFIVPMREFSRKVRRAKPRRGKGGRKVDTWNPVTGIA
jgi:hypothetical protein